MLCWVNCAVSYFGCPVSEAAAEEGQVVHPVEVVEGSEVKECGAEVEGDFAAGAEVVAGAAMACPASSWTTSWMSTCQKPSPTLTPSWTPTWRKPTLDGEGRTSQDRQCPL